MQGFRARARIVVGALGMALAAGSSAHVAIASECTVPEEQMAETLFGAWSAALKTQHPDRVTRMFADDGVLLGFASPIGREGYMPIRDYFLYFLQYGPKPNVVDRKINAGCDFLIDQGTLVWTLKPRSGGAAETRETRYRIMYEKAEGGWRIAEFGDALTSSKESVAYFAVPPPGSGTGKPIVVDPASGAAVAGFVKRVEPNGAPISKVGGPSAPVSAKPQQRDQDVEEPTPAKAKGKTSRKITQPAAENFGLDSLPRDMQQ